MASFRWLGVVVACLGCGSSGTNFQDAGTGPDTSTTDTGGPSFMDASMGPLVISPANAVLTATGTPVTQAYTATQGGMPVTGVGFSVDNAPLGGFSGDVFTAVGNVGGIATVTGTLGGSTGTTLVTVNASITENPGNLTMAQQNALTAGGSADASVRWLYPYDKTVFPRGIPSPVLQMDGTAATTVYVHTTSKYFEYKGFYTNTGPTAVTLTPTAWHSIAYSSGYPSDTVHVEVTVSASGQVTGPVAEDWVIAPTTLKGTVYYNSYNSPLAGNNGATMAIKTSTATLSVLAGTCQVCHSVSPNGGNITTRNRSMGQSGTLTSSIATLYNGSAPQFSMPTFYPDGTFYLTGDMNAVPGGDMQTMAGLYDTKTGAAISFSGLGSVDMAMPSFSADGTKVVFSKQTASCPSGCGVAQTVSVLSFDHTTHAFSGLTDMASTSASGINLVWPQFTPDDAAVIYNTNNRTDYSTQGSGGGGVDAKGNLQYTTVSSKATLSLDAANGYAGGKVYLPYGSAEQDMNFDTTVLPIAAGGYFWVVFTSRRCYGNTLTPTTDPDPYAYGTARRKKLWVTAISINPPAGSDPSHPAFMLPGQELAAGNLRGFWSLDPCKANGTTCESGDECCGGYCRDVGSQAVCVPPPGGCSNEYEACTSAASCCGSNVACINGHCASVPPN